MKLYSRNQLIAYVLTGAVLTAAILLMSGAVSGMRDRITGVRNEPVTVNLDVVDNPLESGIRSAQAGGDDVSDEDNNIRIYELYNDAVVNVTTEKLRYTWFFDPVPQEGGTGSGSIIDDKGYVLTNYHVVEDAYKVYVTLSDGSRHEGEVIGKDAENDLAVIKFDPGDIDLVTIPFGSSDGLRVGQKVLAIGNPFAFERTLTTGIISGLGRPVRGESNYVIQDMIQTDASINPGNSGGPLLNSKGEMIGINALIYTPSGGSVGIGFASPIDTALRILPDLIEFGIVKRGWVDIVPVQLEASIVRFAELSVEKGILVSSVASGGNAEKAGLKGGTERVRYGMSSYIYLGGDIIVGINGSAIESLSDFFGALESSKPGDTVELIAIRGDKERTFSLETIRTPG